MNYFNNLTEIESLVSRLIDKLDASRTEHLELSVGDVRIALDRHCAPPPHSAPAMSPHRRFRQYKPFPKCRPRRKNPMPQRSMPHCSAWHMPRPHRMPHRS